MKRKGKRKNENESERKKKEKESGKLLSLKRNMKVAKNFFFRTELGSHNDGNIPRG